MLFTSHLFIFYFLPAVLLAYYLLPGRRNLVLTAASYVFYGWADPRYVPLLLAATVINFIGGRIISRSAEGTRRRYRALLACLALSLGLLGFFKYFMFFQGNLNFVLDSLGLPALPVLSVTLPAGISFFTFLGISYPIALYLGIAPPVRSFLDFACFVALFPLVIAGPIMRYNLLSEQLAGRTHSRDKFSSGVALFILGFAKKILLANLVAKPADAVFSAGAPGVLDSWFGVAAYAFQIYFDFSAYSDMAVGLGRMFGFEFMHNFNVPYLADSITDFWRRWHISLSSMLRDYVYTPLIAVGRTRNARYIIYRNTILTMLICGLWHGATWLFVLWGGFHGVAMALEHWRGKKGVYASLPRPVRVGFTFLLILASWVLFRSETLAGAWRYYGAMLGLAGAQSGPSVLGALLYTPASLLVMAGCALLAFHPVRAADWVEKLTGPKVVLLIGLFVLSLTELFVQSVSPFLYARF